MHGALIRYAWSYKVCMELILFGCYVAELGMPGAIRYAWSFKISMAL